MTSQRARLYRASTRASCVPVGFGGSAGCPRSSHRCRSSRVKRGIGRGERGHRAPQLAESDVVVGGEPRPQLDVLAGPGQEGEQVLADPLAAPPRLVGGRRELLEHVAPHPRDRLVGVELGADGVELAPGLVDDADRDRVDGGAVLDELGVVEEAAHAPRYAPLVQAHAGAGDRRRATGVTALVVGDQGDVLARGYREFGAALPPGWVEHEPEDIWTATVAACREALAGSEHQPTCIRITDQRETAVVWDRRALPAPPPRDRLAGPPHHRHLRPAAGRRRRAAGRRAHRPAAGPVLHRHEVRLARHEHEPQMWSVSGTARWRSAPSTPT